jgi:hypothetical protein
MILAPAECDKFASSAAPAKISARRHAFEMAMLMNPAVPEIHS